MKEIKSNSQKKLKLILLEFSFFLFIFATILPSNLLLNQILKQSCIQSGYKKLICDEISQSNNNKTEKIEEELQPYVAKINVIITFLYTSVPAILQLFLGPWSDKYGRKSVMNLASIGYVLTHTLAAAICYYSDNIHPLPPWIFIFCYIPVNFLGGFQSMLTAIVCYIKDTCEESKCFYHFTIIEILILFGYFCGILLCSILVELTNAVNIFIIAAICTFIGAIIVIFFIDESLKEIEKSYNLNSILSCSHIFDMIKTCLIPRALHQRSILLSLIFIISLNKFVTDDERNLCYLFERVVYNWTLNDHNFFEATKMLMTVAGTTFAMTVLKNFLKISDLILIAFAIFSNLIDNILRAFAKQSWQVYVISIFSSTRMIVHPLCRSLISSIVLQNEMGKVMSFASTIESIVNFILMPIYLSVYEATFLTFPGAFYFVSAGIGIITLLIVFYVIFVNGFVVNIKKKYVEI
ncbi:hypothetical protein PVAND_015303 [Polypedilum vanderplanki]|uniref:Proton-coupled folate transporter-like protein n=1 Tax=Polypedilum vanderplanki TaxID=319348 RepID=A0A9J6BCE1_POLVA|nr:hypothetical protein PVAND_015303 [Polypedilum vanderplanki]